MIGTISIKNPIMKGTILLTITGFITRIIGFYYRIFLTNLIGAKQLGIYQLIFPVYMVALSLCCYGLQSALTKLVSFYHAQNKHKDSIHSFLQATSISLSLGILANYLLYRYADFVGTYWIQNVESISCIRIVAFGIPFVAIKCGIHGYLLGNQKSGVIAFSQLIEQFSRVIGTWLIAHSFFTNNPYNATLATYGIVCGEIISCLFSVLCMCNQISKEKGWHYLKMNPFQTKSTWLPLLKDGATFTTNRFSMTLLQSLEAVLLPITLNIFYQNMDSALELFGVITGMAIPFILLPSTITNALSSMLLPAVSESYANQNANSLSKMTSTTVHFCSLVGIFSTILFLIFGKELGIVTFQNEMAGNYIFMMAFLCPFIYLSTTLSSVLNGLNKTGLNLFFHLAAIAIRITFILFLVPQVGVKGYMWGLLASYLFLTLMLLLAIRSRIQLEYDSYQSIMIPTVIAGLLGAVCYIGYDRIKISTSLNELVLLAIIICIYGLLYFFVLLFPYLRSIIRKE